MDQSIGFVEEIKYNELKFEEVNFFFLFNFIYVIVVNILNLSFLPLFYVISIAVIFVFKHFLRNPNFS